MHKPWVKLLTALLCLAASTVTAADINITNITAATDVATNDYVLGTVNGQTRRIPVSKLVPVLPSNVLTNNSTNLTLSGTFSGTFYGSASTLTNIPGANNSSLFHRRANQPIPMGLMYNLSGSWNGDHNLILSVARCLATNNLVQHGYNVVLMNCGALSDTRDVNGDLQVGQSTILNVPNMVTELATNGCYLGLFFYFELPEYRPSGYDECGSLLVTADSAYRDGYTIGRWGVRVVWNGGWLPAEETTFRNLSESFHLGLYDGAAAGGWSYVPNSMISSFDSRNYRWVPEVWNMPYTRSDLGQDMVGIGIKAWQDAFFHTMTKYSWMLTDGSEPQLTSFTLAGTGDTWVNADNLRSIFGMMCMNSMPLLIGSVDIRPTEMAVFTNDAAIMIDQDALRAPPYIISSNSTSAVVGKQLWNGDVAVALWNLSTNSPTTISVALTNVLGLHTNFVSVLDVFDAAKTSASNILSATINVAGLNLYRLSAGQSSAINFTLGPNTNVPAINGASTNQLLSAPMIVGGIVASSAVFTATCPTNPCTTNLTIWLKADAGSYTNGVGSDWLDSSGNGNDATNSAGWPIFRTNVVNTLPAFQFTNGSFLVSKYINSGIKTNFVMVAVFKQTTWNTTETLFDMGADAFDYYYVWPGNHQMTFQYINVAASATLGAWTIGGCYYRNGQISSWSGASTNINTSPYPHAMTGSNPYIGSSIGGDYPWSGYLSELLYYEDGLSQADLNTLITTYLQPKYLAPWPVLVTPVDTSPIASRKWVSEFFDTNTVAAAKLPIAGTTAETRGAVYVDNSTIIVDGQGKLAAVTGSGGAFYGTNVIGAVPESTHATNADYSANAVLTTDPMDFLMGITTNGEFSVTGANPGLVGAQPAAAILTNVATGDGAALSNLNSAKLTGTIASARLPVAGATAAAVGGIWLSNSASATLNADGQLIISAGGGEGGAATNAISRVYVNGALSASGPTNLYFWQGAYFLLTYTNRSPEQGVDIGFIVSGVQPTNAYLTLWGTMSTNVLATLSSAAYAAAVSNNVATLSTYVGLVSNTVPVAVAYTTGVSNNVRTLSTYVGQVSNTVPLAVAFTGGVSNNVYALSNSISAQIASSNTPPGGVLSWYTGTTQYMSNTVTASWGYLDANWNFYCTNATDGWAFQRTGGHMYLNGVEVGAAPTAITNNGTVAVTYSNNFTVDAAHAFIGALTGQATAARNDSLGNRIDTTYWPVSAPPVTNSQASVAFGAMSIGGIEGNGYTNYAAGTTYAEDFTSPSVAPVAYSTAVSNLVYVLSTYVGQVSNTVPTAVGYTTGVSNNVYDLQTYVAAISNTVPPVVTFAGAISNLVQDLQTYTVAISNTVPPAVAFTAAVSNRVDTVNIAGTRVLWPTNAITQVVNMNLGESSFTTNAAFAFSGYSNLSVTNYQHLLVHVYGAGTAIAITFPANTHIQGTANVTNLTDLQFDYYPDKPATNVICLPRY